MYIWQKEIKTVEKELVTFTDWTTAEYSEDYIKYLSSKEKKDDAQLQIDKLLKIQSDILKIFQDSSATKTEISQTLWDVSENIARHEKNILSNLCWVENYLDINFRELSKHAIKIQNKNFTN